MEIPMIILWAGVAVAVVYSLIADWNQFGTADSLLSLNLISSLIAGIVAFLFFFVLAAASKETWMGMGDAYLGLLAAAKTKKKRKATKPAIRLEIKLSESKLSAVPN
jgi:hypothetical protein